MNEIDFTKEMLEKVLGGANASAKAKFYSFTGDYAVQQAQDVLKEPGGCLCGCQCVDKGKGGGAGAGA